MSSFETGQFVTVFRSRLRTENSAAYYEEAARMGELAVTMPGFVDVKSFTADDGERVTIATFADAESQRGWRVQSEHAAAQSRGRSEFYAEYSLQVCEAVRVRAFNLGSDTELDAEES